VESSRVHIGEVVRNAIVFDSKNQTGDIVRADSVFGDVERLFDLLHDREVDYLLAGGIAMLRYVDGRNTEVLDLIMAVSDLAKIPELEVGSEDANFARCRFGQLRVDLLLTRNPLFKKVKRRYATTGRFVERDYVPCATVEGLLLLKLYALPSLYRQGNFARVGLYENDIATLIQAYQPALEPLLAELEVHLSRTDLAALRDIVADIMQRIERFGRGSVKTGNSG
jgi:hypothetical protein